MSRASGPIEDQIAELDGFSRDELLDYWSKRYGIEPYKGIRKASLIRGAAYDIQAKTLGGLRPITARRLLKLAKGDTHASPNRGAKFPSFKPRTRLGSRLVREWNGRTYEVVVADSGYVLNGVTHSSLTACAKAITGAHWSGPRFFGVAS